MTLHLPCLGHGQWRVTSGRMTWGQVSKRNRSREGNTLHPCSHTAPTQIHQTGKCSTWIPGGRAEPRCPGAAPRPPHQHPLQSVYRDLSALMTAPPSGAALCSWTRRPRTLVGSLPALRPLFWRFFITAHYLKDDTSVFSLSPPGNKPTCTASVVGVRTLEWPRGISPSRS